MMMMIGTEIAKESIHAQATKLQFLLPASSISAT